jgi:guanylate kinase
MRVDGRTIHRAGCLFIVSGPSGAGKTSICTPALAELQDIGLSVSVTTRAPRGGEVDGIDYRFVDEAEFDRLLAADGFAEWAEVHGNRYGTARTVIDAALGDGQDLLLDIDVQGARQMKAAYPDSVAIFLLPPSKEHLRARLEGRGTDTPETVTRRLDNACREIAAIDGYDYVIVNDDLALSVRQFLAIVQAERQRTLRLLASDKRVTLDAFNARP